MSRPTPSIDEVFFAAMERESPEARAAYLDEVCAGDPDLRGRIERLLDLQPKVGSFLNAPAAGPTLTLTPPQAMEGPGTVIGPYKLLEQIGEGGMGVVYMAEQTQPLRRKVALKIIKPGMDTKQVIARFEAERQALAMMDHPSIARVFDAGATESGRPYFVMELVRGIPITEYCDQQRLSIPERLGLFTQVCQAVQHAHQKGIIHRDLKPTNVLVTSLDGTPLPKVIDFGIAKATGQSLTDKTLFTGFAQLIGTPLYMSPEQAELSAVDVDTRSDIYSLGVLLYELLTGTTPFDQFTFRTAALDELRRIIREQEPPKPSTRLSESKDTLPSISARRHTEPARLTRLLRGELDWIAMKALEKDRRRRYETASGLARDVERYLAGEPVEAGPPSAWYRFRKFARRNRVVLTTTVLVALALIVGTAVSVWQAVLARRARADAFFQRDRAEANYRLARDAVDRMLAEVGSKTLADVPQAEPVRRALLEEALRFYQEFLKQRSDEPALRRELGRAYRSIGEVNSLLGRHAQADEACLQSIAILGDLSSSTPEDSELKVELAKAHYRRGNVLHYQDRDAEAIREFRLALALWRAVPPVEARAAEILKDQTGAQNNLGVVLMSAGQLAEAETAFREVIDLLQPLAARSPDDAECQHTVGGGLLNLGVIAFQRGDLAGARALFERALPHQRAAVKAAPRILKYRQFLTNIQENLAVVRIQLGDRVGAVQAMREVIALGEAIAADFPNVPRYGRDLAQSYCNLGNMLKESGQLPEAEREYRRALDAFQSLASRFPDVPGHQKDLADGRDNLAELLRIAGRFGEAAQEYRRALDLYERLETSDPGRREFRSDLASCRARLARMLANCPDPQVRDPSRAVSLAQQAIELIPKVGPFWNTLGAARYRAGDWLGAISALEQARKLRSAGEASDGWEPSMKPRWGGEASDGLFLAMAHWQKGDKERARSWFDGAIAWMDKNRPTDEELLHLRAEASALLGMTDHPKSSGTKEEDARRRSKP